MKLKLLICYHKPFTLFKDDVLTPIHVGRETSFKRDSKSDSAQWLKRNCIGDDTGDNISSKNSSYNEMTSLYWAWKNYDKLGDPEYIGMMHYRRHFVFREGEKGEVRFDDLDVDNYFDQIGYSKEKAEEFVDGLDYVVHMGTVDNVYKHYIDSHKKEDLDEAISIVKELHPEYSEVCDDYFAGNDSNFCNMFILKKELFFEYCEFVFSVLEEFERRVDLTDKRLFISERVTGIFFAKLLKDKSLKYKVVPISYIDAPIPVNIVLHRKHDSLYPLAVTLTSLLKSKEDRSVYNIKIVLDRDLSKYERYVIDKCCAGYSNVNLSFEINKKGQDLLSFIESIYSNTNKCLLLSDNALVLNDLRDFFPTVSVDDYFISGSPKYGYNHKDKKCVTDDVLVLNLAKIRSKKIDDINTCHTGYIPQYYLTITSDETEEWTIFDSNRSRQQIINDSSWKRMICYNTWSPWENPQEPLSFYWWKYAQELPVNITFPAYDEEKLLNTLSSQQKMVNERVCPIEHMNYQIEECEEQPVEEWRNYSMLGKLKFYYDHNGFKSTVKYCSKKYLIRR
ncbi:protein of unknown function [Lachnospiraceae bacterium A10]|nr:protein of unknown function [Lachnospiraceae bacterium A10]